MADDAPWLKFQSDTPATTGKPWEKFQASPAAPGPSMSGPEATPKEPAAEFKSGEPAEPDGPWMKFRKGLTAGMKFVGEHLGIPEGEIKNKKGETVFPTNAAERGLQATSAPTFEAAMGTQFGMKGGPLRVPKGTLIEKIFSPTTVSPKAGEAEASIRTAGGQAARSTEQTAAAMEPYHRAVNAASEPERYDFISYVEGEHQNIPKKDLAPLAGELRKAMELRRQKLESMPKTAQAQFVDDFYAHMWQDPVTGNKVNFVGGGRGAGKQGSGASLKARTIPTISEGIKAGLKPITTDPIETTMRYAASMDKFIAQQEVFEAAVNNGTIKYVRPKVYGASGNPSSFKVPEGYVPLEGRGATNIKGERAYAPADWARVYNNYISRGFHGNEEAGRFYDGIQSVSNGITAMELGLSGYHAFTMANEAIISDVAKGISQLVGGQPIRALGSLAKAPAAPVTKYQLGKKGEQVYLGRTPGTPDLRRLVDLQTAAGGRAVGKGHSPDYRFSKMGSYWTAFKRGALKAEMAQSKANIQARPIVGTGKELFKVIGRTMETVAQPIFEKMIPRIKNGAFYDVMGEWIKANPTAPYDAQVAMARKIWDSIDNRFGEMVQDNIFWNKTMKQVAQVAMRSYSWNMGTVREIGGGAISAATKPGRISIKSKDYDPRAAYVLALPMTMATINAVYQFLKTGKAPESPEDLVAPRTGGTSPGFGGRGEVEERAMLPGYHRDVLGWWNDAKQEAANKFAKGPHMAFQIAQPGGMKDFAGNPVVDQSKDAMSQLGQYFSWAADSISPISVKQVMQGNKTGSNLGFLSSMAGVRPAPMHMQDPEGTKRGMEAIARRDANKKRKADLRRERQYGGPQE
jgi:hypothetical protein